MKRKLVLSFGNHVQSRKELPQQYSVTKQHWACEVASETEEGVVDEYDVLPDRKLYLNDFLDIVNDEVSKLSETGKDTWSVKIFRLTKR